jgi:glycosyltransferase involved in cell wall biosynthesis
MYLMSLSVALVHDYLREYGGAERVLEALHAQFPEAPVYTAFIDRQALGKQAARFAGWDIRETLLTRLPFYKKLFSPYRIFAAWAFERLNLGKFDIIISSTNMYMAKAVRKRADALHISYIHTPPRSLYGYTTKSDWRSQALTRVGGELINVWMRYWDAVTARRPDILVANSRTTQERIQKFYRRESVIIPPPVTLVDQHLLVLPSTERTYALFVGRLAFSKHPQLAVEICRQLRLPLKVVGTGAMMEQLQALAEPVGSTIEFLGSVNDQQLAQLYQQARVVLYPAEEEDFGIVPIEAMATGTPVIAHFSGEPRYTVQDGKNGLHVHSWDPVDWQAALTKAWKQTWDYQRIQQSVQKYATQNFQSAMAKLIYQKK